MERGVPIRSISRCIAVLQAVNRRGALSLMEIARAASLPYPTTCRMVQTLIHEGLVECEPTRKLYRATALVQTLSQGFPNHDRLLTAARPPIEAFTRAAGWPVSVITRVGLSMMVRDSTQNLTSLTFNLYSSGYVMPMLECASGYLHLAYASTDERQALLDSLASTDARSPLLPLFRDSAAVQKIRDDGFATYERQPHADSPGTTSSISVPIFDDATLAGALTMSFFASAMPIDGALARHLEDLKATAGAISETLAASPRPAPVPPRQRKPRAKAIDRSALQATT